METTKSRTEIHCVDFVSGKLYLHYNRETGTLRNNVTGKRIHVRENDFDTYLGICKEMGLNVSRV